MFDFPWKFVVLRWSTVHRFSMAWSLRRNSQTWSPGSTELWPAACAFGSGSGARCLYDGALGDCLFVFPWGFWLALPWKQLQEISRNGWVGFLIIWCHLDVGVALVEIRFTSIEWPTQMSQGSTFKIIDTPVAMTFPFSQVDTNCDDKNLGWTRDGSTTFDGLGGLFTAVLDAKWGREAKSRAEIHFQNPVHGFVIPFLFTGTNPKRCKCESGRLWWPKIFIRFGSFPIVHVMQCDT